MTTKHINIFVCLPVSRILNETEAHFEDNLLIIQNLSSCLKHNRRGVGGSIPKYIDTTTTTHSFWRSIQASMDRYEGSVSVSVFHTVLTYLNCINRWSFCCREHMWAFSLLLRRSAPVLSRGGEGRKQRGASYGATSQLLWTVMS